MIKRWMTATPYYLKWVIVIGTVSVELMTKTNVLVIRRPRFSNILTAQTNNYWYKILSSNSDITESAWGMVMIIRYNIHIKGYTIYIYIYEYYSIYLPYK
jgi:hypothetical protein